MRPDDMSNLHIEDHLGLTVNWNDSEGNRYHAWIVTDDDDRKAWITDGLMFRSKKKGGCIFKNPPLNVQYKREGWYPTRYLDANSKTWKPVVDRIMHYLMEGGGLAAARVKKLHEAADQLRIQKAKARAAAEKAALEAAAPHLLKALKLAYHSIVNVMTDDQLDVSFMDDGTTTRKRCKMIETAIKLTEVPNE
jgi:hypothetical protein